MIPYCFLGVAIIVEIIATTMLKASEGFTRIIPALIALGGYAISFYCLSLALKVIPVGIAYAIWSGIGTVGICILAWLIYRQELSLFVIGGIGLIILGVIMINFGQIQNIG